VSKDQKILEVNELQTSFKSQNSEVIAVVDLNFDLYRGEVLGIVGESGSGKSVSVLSLMKLLPAKRAKVQGQIIFDGVNLAGLDEDKIRPYRGKKMAMIFQEPMSSLNPTMQLGKQVQEMIELHTDLKGSSAKERVLELFNKVKLPNPERLYDAYAHQASGGQLQRVMIAMAISTNPDILIADEPTTALDVTVQREILELIKEIQQESNTATIFISHDLSLIKNLCDRVIVMHQGKVVEAGAVDEIFNHPSHPYTQGLIACRPQENFNLNRLPTVEDFLNGSVSKVEKKLREKSPELVLQVSNLKKYFPAKKNWLGKTLSYTKAVDDVDFKIAKGEILGLVGGSGCGKSTLGKMVTRLVDPDSGSINYKGKDVTNIVGDKLRTYRKEVQMIFQDPYGSLNPRMKIGEAIMEPMLSHKMYPKSVAQEKTIALLEQTGLKAEHFERYPHEFSGGQRQRIPIARDLSLNPELLVCDECISALDVSVQAQIINLLLDLRDDLDLSILFIAHDLAAVRFISDQVAVMYNGKIVEKGNPEIVYNNPQNEYTKKLLAAIQV